MVTSGVWRLGLLRSQHSLETHPVGHHRTECVRWSIVPFDRTLIVKVDRFGMRSAAHLNLHNNSERRAAKWAENDRSANAHALED